MFGIIVINMYFLNFYECFLLFWYYYILYKFGDNYILSVGIDVENIVMKLNIFLFFSVCEYVCIFFLFIFLELIFV